MTTKTKTRMDIYQRVTNQIITYLEKGTAPWHRSWGQFGLAKNYVSGKPYRGINALMMNTTPFAIPYFLTMKQANALGGKVKKGSIANMVMYYNTIYKDKNGKTIPQEVASKMPEGSVNKRGFLKYFYVFATEQIEGIDFHYPEVQLKENEKIERCEELVKNIPSPPEFVSINASRCYYEPLLDCVNMPPIEHFDSSEEYYNSLYHELIHSTGHEKRLNREGITGLTIDRKSYSYSAEELVAELGASFLCGISGIDCKPLLENNASYINGWLKVLKEDSKFIFRVAKDAQKAVDYLMYY